MGPLLFFDRSSSTHHGPRSCIIHPGMPPGAVGTRKSVVLMAKKNWISGGIRNGIRTGMRTTVVGSRRVVVLMAMTPTISTPRTTIITRISSSHLGPPHRLDGVRIFCLGLTNPNLSLSLSFFNVWGVEVSSWDICCCFVDPLGSGKAGFLVGSGLGYPRV